MWPCDELPTCPGGHPAFSLSQLGEAPADLRDPEIWKKWVWKMERWVDGKANKNYMSKMHQNAPYHIKCTVNLPEITPKLISRHVTLKKTEPACRAAAMEVINRCRLHRRRQQQQQLQAVSPQVSPTLLGTCRQTLGKEGRHFSSTVSSSSSLKRLVRLWLEQLSGPPAPPLTTLPINATQRQRRLPASSHNVWLSTLCAAPWIELE